MVAVIIPKGYKKAETRIKMKIVIFFSYIPLLLVFTGCAAQVKQEIPAIYSNISRNEGGLLEFKAGEKHYVQEPVKIFATENDVLPVANGTETGISLQFGRVAHKITYGIIPYGKMKFPLPVYRYERKLDKGKIEIDIPKDFNPTYDMVQWQESGKMVLGYRLSDSTGMLLFEGEIAIEGNGPFSVVPAIWQGPFVCKIQPDRATVWYKTTLPVKSKLLCNGKTLESAESATFHEINIEGLNAGTQYEYSIQVGDFQQQFSFTTAPEKGSSNPFVFAYTSDSRKATGGGERNMYGTNYYVVSRSAAVAMQHNAAFFQFTGDMINGYLTNSEDWKVQMHNWKKALEPFGHYMPVYVGQGNHEALGYVLTDSDRKNGVFIAGFPTESFSAEAMMQQAFINPENGPESEDGSKYDPSAKSTDFPSYKENVYYYTYGNTAMIVLNSDYWYTPTLSGEPLTSGGLHGYLMDNQIKWLQDVLTALENDASVQHIFVTHHTPVFPNGGHSTDDMWYSGDNSKRPYIEGKPVGKGIIERRDEYLDLLINKSSKVVAVLTGDEHNYNRLKLTADVKIHPDGYTASQLKVSRPIWQINNGACGAPYYAQEQLPWTPHVEGFSVENAVCLFYIDGNSVQMKVVNPVTLNVLDEVKLK
jgi:hypothetical protein